MNDIKDNIIKKIRAGEVHMVPRWQFVLKTTLFGVSVLIVAMIAVYLCSFILFALHETGVWFAPEFGLSGLMFFVIASPWVLISLVGIFLLILYFLVTHYSFSYRKPLVYSLVGVVLFVTAVASLIQYSELHKHIDAFVERHEIPGLAPLYRGLTKERPESMVVGSIESIDDEELTVATEQGVLVEVELSPRTKMPPNKALEIGDMVMVFGNFQGDDLVAFGIRFVTDGVPSPLNNQMIVPDEHQPRFDRDGHFDIPPAEAGDGRSAFSAEVDEVELQESVAGDEVVVPKQ